MNRQHIMLWKLRDAYNCHFGNCSQDVLVEADRKPQGGTRTTFVEAVVSADGGATWSKPFEVTGMAPGEPTHVDGGQFHQTFYPCPTATLGYFGDYISGTFQDQDPTSQAVVVAWTDSRKGCTGQTSLTTLQHQHVYVGGGRP